MMMDFEQAARLVWLRFLQMDGVQVFLTPEEFRSEVASDTERIHQISRSGIPCTATIGYPPVTRLSPEDRALLEEINRTVPGQLSEEKLAQFARLYSSTPSGPKNYFIVNDLLRGTICQKCGSSTYMVLLSDSDLTALAERIFLPSAETYISQGIIPGDNEEFMRAFPVPVDPKQDLWYCPVCRELHPFRYDSDIGLTYDQTVWQG